MSTVPVWQAAGPFSVKRRVRWGDCDPAGVVYTPRFADYAVEAYQDFLAQLLDGPVGERQRELDLGTPAMSLHLAFKRSLYPDDLVELQVRVIDVRTRSFDIAVDALGGDGGLAFTATLGFVCVHHAVRKSRPIPPLLRQRLCDCRDRFPRPVSGDAPAGVSPEAGS